MIETIAIDRATPADAIAARSALMRLLAHHVLLLLGARERTEAEFRGLRAAAGFELARVVMTASPAGLEVIEARPR